MKVWAMIIVDLDNGTGDASDVMLSLYPSRAVAEASVITDAQENWSDDNGDLPKPLTFEQACDFEGYDGEAMSLEIREVELEV